MRNRNDQRKQWTRRSILSAAAGLSASAAHAQQTAASPSADDKRVCLTLGYDGTRHTKYFDFLEALVKDDPKWKEKLKKDPDAVLKGYGIVFDPPIGEPLEALPDKGRVKTFLEALKACSPSAKREEPKRSHIHHLWCVISTGGR